MPGESRFDVGITERTEGIEMSLLLEAIYQRYEYDFRNYAEASIRRRMHKALQLENLHTLSSLQDRVLHDAECMARLLDVLSVDVSAMFRDPSFYRTVKDKVLPGFKSLPHIKVWIAGCATGQEVFSVAIWFHEAGLLDKTLIYATDFNERRLSSGRAAIFSIKKMNEYSVNYIRSGGDNNFSDYFTANLDCAIMRDFLRKNIIWSEHNLVSDGSFNEFDLVFCRNVMIYFNHSLQNLVLNLLCNSLTNSGVLCLGHGESLHGFSVASAFDVISIDEKIFRKHPSTTPA